MHNICKNCGASLDYGERCSCEKDTNTVIPDIIVTDSAGNVNGQFNPSSITARGLKNAAALFAERAADIESYLRRVTDEAPRDTPAELKTRRASLNKILEAFERRRVDLKKELLSEYDDFTAIYNDRLRNPVKRAISALDEQITAHDSARRQRLADFASAYFAEAASAAGIDFVSLDQTGVKLTLTTSEKSIREKIDSFLGRIRSEMSVISLQSDPDEIMAEYKATLSLADAVHTVNTRRELVKAEAARREAAGRRAAEEAARREAVRKTADAFSPTPDPAPDDIGAPVRTRNAPEKPLTLAFTATGARDNLKRFADTVRKAAAAENITLD